MGSSLLLAAKRVHQEVASLQFRIHIGPASWIDRGLARRRDPAWRRRPPIAGGRVRAHRTPPW